VAKYDGVYRPSTEDPFYRGEINVAYNALDRHVDAGRSGQAALIYDSPVTGVV
jgi:propionyl-CoA synthetase